MIGLMIRRCLPLDGDPEELALQAAGFAALRSGEVLTASELGFRAHLEGGRAEAASERLLGRGALLVTDDGRIDGIAGLTLRPTRHELTIDATATHTWCAFDSVGIPAAIGADAIAVTSCGHCSDRIEVREALRNGTGSSQRYSVRSTAPASTITPDESGPARERAQLRAAAGSSMRATGSPPGSAHSRTVRSSLAAATSDRSPSRR